MTTNNVAAEIAQLTEAVRKMRAEFRDDILRYSSPSPKSPITTKTTAESDQKNGDGGEHTNNVRQKIKNMSAEVVDSNPYRFWIFNPIGLLT